MTISTARWARLIEVYEQPFFEGPWQHDAELATAFLTFARRELTDLFDEYGGLNNAAYCIELCLGDEDPDEHADALASFIAQLEPALAARATGLIADDLANRAPEEATALRREMSNGEM